MIRVDLTFQHQVESTNLIVVDYVGILVTFVFAGFPTVSVCRFVALVFVALDPVLLWSWLGSSCPGSAVWSSYSGELSVSLHGLLTVVPTGFPFGFWIGALICNYGFFEEV